MRIASVNMNVTNRSHLNINKEIFNACYGFPLSHSLFRVILNFLPSIEQVLINN